VLRLIVAEPGSDAAARHWRAADQRASSRLLYPEARAALGAARRADLLDDEGLAQARRALQRRCGQLVIIEAGRGVAREAARLAERHALPVVAAVHLASALAAERTLDDVVLVTWDPALARAARRDGLPTAGADDG